ncbi:MAG: flagellar biosynthesis anti-sigma factor FlgM, partial [Oscillospiraceae bacterium]
MDTVSISREGLEKSLTARLARSTANEIDNYATPEKLSALKQKIDSGEYNVSSSAVANAILGTDFTD